jgi:transcriptional regulator GlxA family with amidase domain
VLANRFQRLVGTGVIAYLTAHRMYAAAEMLINTRQPLVTIANAVCYESEISFSRAFREWAGIPPGKYRRISADVKAA